jgi:quinol-cytochrome oxidoreductase complex cytochrome b subunit
LIIVFNYRVSQNILLLHFLLLLLLLQHSLLPGGIILQGVLLIQGSMRVFACHYSLLPIVVIGLVTREEEFITSYS